MKNDIVFYPNEQLDSYYKKYKMNVLYYVLSLIVFIGISVILHLFLDDLLFVILIAILDIAFINFSIYFIYRINKINKVVRLFLKMKFGNKINKQVHFIRNGKEIVINGLSYNEFIFKDQDNSEVKLYLYAFINDRFIIGNNYNLSLVNDLIYGCDSYEKGI